MFAVVVAFVTGCEEVGFNYWGNDIDSVENVSSWNACAKICNEHKSCQYWSWTIGLITHQRCWLKTSKSGRVKLGNAISGRHDCL